VAGLSEASPERFALLLGLSLFFGFAFEEFYSDELAQRPGGVRTFPLLALTGGALYLLEPQYGAAFVAGLLVVGSWIYAYVRRQTTGEAAAIDGLFVVPACNVLAYILGPVALTQPVWLSVTVAVVAVLLLGGRRTLHDWAKRVPTKEVTTAGEFLILVGIVLPLLAGRPPIPHTTITPFGVWIAVVAVSSISYVSYLLQRFVFAGRGTLLMAILGGLYSSTATTVVLSRRSRTEGMTPELEAGIVAATAMMYLRVLIVCALFNGALARVLLLPLLSLAAVSAVLAALRSRLGKRTVQLVEPANPLQIWTALVFALLFVAVSLLTALAQRHLGSAGVFALAGIVGFTDIDPFVVSLAQGAATGIAIAAPAIVIAASSNNVLKAAYAVAFSGRREGWIPAAMLASIALLGVAVALLVMR
jgi:uncharacterized membrane protein (DUF4010 family)